MTIASPISLLLVAGLLLVLAMLTRQRRGAGAGRQRPLLAELVLAGLIVLAAGDIRLVVTMSADTLVVAGDLSASASGRSREVLRQLEDLTPASTRQVWISGAGHASDLGALLSTWLMSILGSVTVRR